MRLQVGEELGQGRVEKAAQLDLHGCQEGGEVAAPALVQVPLALLLLQQNTGREQRHDDDDDRADSKCDNGHGGAPAHALPQGVGPVLLFPRHERPALVHCLAFDVLRAAPSGIVHVHAAPLDSVNLLLVLPAHHEQCGPRDHDQGEGWQPRQVRLICQNLVRKHRHAQHGRHQQRR